jgi:hypothetical protein
MKKKLIFALAIGFFAVATVFNMNMLQTNDAGDISLEGIAVMAAAWPEYNPSTPRSNEPSGSRPVEFKKLCLTINETYSGGGASGNVHGGANQSWPGGSGSAGASAGGSYGSSSSTTTVSYTERTGQDCIPTSAVVSICTPFDPPC